MRPRPCCALRCNGFGTGKLFELIGKFPNLVLDRFADFEPNRRLRRNGHKFAGLGIAAVAGLALSQ